MGGEVTKGRFVVAIIGGAVAGSASAEVLAEQGVQTLVIEQNLRPYGKIEDGLPRWHDKQRAQEYVKINERLSRENVVFVPGTGLGREVQLSELLDELKVSAVILANGAWRDRPLSIPGIDAYINLGLVYQNSFIYWFNHKEESGFEGLNYHIPPAPLVIGGGLASIDVIKVVQLELYGKALKERGIEVSMLELEHKGIPAICALHDLDPVSLDVPNGILFYRRRIQDMPVADLPRGSSPEKTKKIQAVREKILKLAQSKYLFEIRPCHLPVEGIIEEGRLVGLKFIQTRIEGRKVLPIEGSEVEYRSDLCISSIGSIPEPLPELLQDGEYYKFQDWDLGLYEGSDRVFAAGNVITGKGNIRVSLKHGQKVAGYVAHDFLGVEPAELRAQDVGEAAAQAVLGELKKREPLKDSEVQKVQEWVQTRHQEVGYTGDYDSWIERVTPADLG